MKFNIDFNKLAGLALIGACGYAIYKIIDKGMQERAEFHEHRDEELKEVVEKNIDKVTLENDDLDTEQRMFTKKYLDNKKALLYRANTVESFDQTLEEFNELYNRLALKDGSKEALAAYILLLQTKEKESKEIKRQETQRMYDKEDRQAIIDAIHNAGYAVRAAGYGWRSITGGGAS